MFKKKGLGLFAQAVVLIGVGLVVTESSFADGCGAYCQARQARAICHEIVKTKGLKGHQRDVEFEKCRVEVMNSQQIKELTDDTGISIE